MTEEVTQADEAAALRFWEMKNAGDLAMHFARHRLRFLQGRQHSPLPPPSQRL